VSVNLDEVSEPLYPPAKSSRVELVSRELDLPRRTSSFENWSLVTVNSCCAKF